MSVLKDVKAIKSMSESPRVIDPAALLLRRAMSDYEVPLTKYALSILHNLEQAQDVVQETFLKLYKQDPEKWIKKSNHGCLLSAGIIVLI